MFAGVFAGVLLQYFKRFSGHQDPSVSTEAVSAACLSAGFNGRAPERIGASTGWKATFDSETADMAHSLWKLTTWPFYKAGRRQPTNLYGYGYAFFLYVLLLNWLFPLDEELFCCGTFCSAGFLPSSFEQGNDSQELPHAMELTTAGANNRSGALPVVWLNEETLSDLSSAGEVHR